MTTDSNFFLDILDQRGFPDLRILREMRNNKESVPEHGTYRMKDFIDKGCYLYGMNRPIKLAAFRKLSPQHLQYWIFEDRVHYHTYYSMNNSDTDPYLILVLATATIDQLILEFEGEQRLKVAQYERSFMRTPDQDDYSDGWFAAMEQKIIRREPADRYPYCLKRAMTLLVRNVRSRELLIERQHPDNPSIAVTRRLPDEEDLKSLSESATTTREIGKLFYKLLARQYYPIDELSVMVDELRRHYDEAAGT